MANYFCDTLVGGGANDGTSFDDAWQTIEGAFENAVMTAGDKLWIRRRSSHAHSGSDIAPTQQGNRNSYIEAIGCPRNVETGTGTVTNGSNVISAVAGGVTPDFEQHGTRRVKNDTDTRYYMITAIAHKIDYGGEVGNFTEGLMVTSGGAGAGVGKIHRLVDNGATGTLWVVVQSGTFGNNEAITDMDTGSAVCNGAGADDGFIIDRKYAGSTTAAGAVTIEKDLDYDTFNAIDDSAWVIKKAAWNGDAADLPVIDFGANAFNLIFYNSNYWWIKNLHLKGSTDIHGLLWLRAGHQLCIENCILEQDNNAYIIQTYGGQDMYVIRRCILRGNYAGASQIGLFANAGESYIVDVAIYNCGDNGIRNIALCNAENVNIGIELPNSDDDLNILFKFVGFDIAIGGANGGILTSYLYQHQYQIGNYQKIQKAHVVGQGAAILIEKHDVVLGAGDPQKRASGADAVIKIPTTTSIVFTDRQIDGVRMPIFEHVFFADATSKSYRYYIQVDGFATTVEQLKLVVEYIDQYDDSDEYHKIEVDSDETCNARANTADWTQYIEVIGIQPAVGSIVRIKCYCSFFSAGDTIYIDPKVVIS